MSYQTVEMQQCFCKEERRNIASFHKAISLLKITLLKAANAAGEFKEKKATRKIFRIKIVAKKTFAVFWFTRG